MSGTFSKRTPTTMVTSIALLASRDWKVRGGSAATRVLFSTPVRACDMARVAGHPDVGVGSGLDAGPLRVEEAEFLER
jgi:hypothetical protein